MQNKDEGTQKGKTIHSFSLKEHHIMQKFADITQKKVAISRAKMGLHSESQGFVGCPKFAFQTAKRWVDSLEDQIRRCTILNKYACK